MARDLEVQEAATLSLPLDEAFGHRCRLNSKREPGAVWNLYSVDPVAFAQRLPFGNAGFGIGAIEVARHGQVAVLLSLRSHQLTLRLQADLKSSTVELNTCRKMSPVMTQDQLPGLGHGVLWTLDRPH